MDVVIIAAPLFAALFLTLVLAHHNEILSADDAFTNERFVVMPRNCYLKIP